MFYSHSIVVSVKILVAIRTSSTRQSVSNPIKLGRIYEPENEFLTFGENNNRYTNI